MKIYSEILHKMFDTAEECETAEEEYTKKQELEEAEKKEKAALVSREKKELSSAVEAAEEALNKAYEDYADAKKRAKEILEESNKACLDILNPAKEAVRQAQEERFKAINAFNKKFGMPYTAYYTGDKAYQELKRAQDWIDNLFGRYLW